MLGFVVDFFSGSIRNFYLATFFQFAKSFDEVDLVLLEKKLNTLAVAGGNITAAFHHAGKIGLESIYLNAVIFCMTDILKYISAFQQCLRGDTSPVQTYATDFRFLDHTHFQPKLRSPDGGYVSSGTTPDYDQIIF